MLSIYHEPDALQIHCLIHNNSPKREIPLPFRGMIFKVMQVKCKYSIMLFLQPKIDKKRQNGKCLTSSFCLAK